MPSQPASISVAEMLARARTAAAAVEYWTQDQVDRAVISVGRECYEESAARSMSEFAYSSTGLGDAEDMFSLHRRRVLGTLWDLHKVKTVGIVSEDRALGLLKIAKPVGVIAATCPATAPCSTAVCISLPTLKTRNAVILIPSPRGHKAIMMATASIRTALVAVGAPADLVQCATRCTREDAADLMRHADLVVATGGSKALERAYSSGTPAIGAGVGNATVIIDDTADLRQAAEMVSRGARLNNGTSCSSESNVLVAETIYEPLLAELASLDVHVCSSEEVKRLRGVMWPTDEHLDRKVIGQSANRLATVAGIDLGSRKVSCLAAPLVIGDAADPMLGEKLSPVFSLISYREFEQAIESAQYTLSIAGAGHSAGIHSKSQERVLMFASRIRSARLLVNQSIAIGNSGSYDNGLPFSSTVACGTWGGCGQSENITWRNYLNYTTVSSPIDEIVIEESVVFANICG